MLGPRFQTIFWFKISVLLLVTKISLANLSSHRPQVAPSATAKNVLYFVVDDYRNELNAAYGQSDILTPSLDRLAKESLVFDRAYCQQAVCSPSRNSFLSGRRPDSTRVYGNGKVSFRTVGPDWITMPEHFKQHGYLTLGGGKTFHPNSPKNWDEPKSWSQDMPYFPFKMTHCPYFTEKLGTWCALNGSLDQFYDNRLANWTISALNFAKQQPTRIDTGKRPPFFIMAGFRRPHGPWKVPNAYWDLYNTSSMTLPTNMPYPTDAPNISYIKTSFWQPPKKVDGYPGGPGNYKMWNTSIDTPIPLWVQREARHAYYSAVSWMDSQVGSVLKHLDNIGLANDTIVVLHGDHGYSLGEHNMYHKFCDFELTVRTPLLIRVPWKTASIGTHTSVLAELVDLYPTLASLAGTPKPTDSIEGTDISKIFENPTDTSIKEAAFSQFPRCPKDPSMEWERNMCGSGNFTGYMGYAIRTNEYRYVAWIPWANGKGNWDIEPHARELYPHPMDDDACLTNFNKCEVANVAGKSEYVKIIQKLHAQLKKQFDRSMDVNKKIRSN